ncbi:MAG: PAS domain-containing sensor histidine kinase [Deltaproteobacteria bacterium]|nr:MAG: PAS domain-containing sensor histidine kinase [Deltaproteobacteria bacterium]
MMSATNKIANAIPTRLPLNIAIVGGGKACKFFLELLQTNYFRSLDINLIGVCDIDPEAEGLQMAEQMGIYTTDNFKDFFEFKDLDSILELTNNRNVLLDLVKLRPKGVGVLEHNIGQFFRLFYNVDQQLKSAEYQANLQKMFSDFLIQQSNQAIVVLNTDFTISEVNESYLNIVKRKREDVLGEYCYRAYYGLRAPCASSNPMMQCPMLETLRSGKSAQVVHEYTREKYSTFYGNIVTYPLTNKDGDIFQVIEIINDITDAISSGWEKRVKELKADLNKMVQEDRMISLGKLAASCVHEINNPIHGLLTFTDLMQEMLAEGNPTPERLEKFKKFLSIMSSELERCGNIVTNLLSFSRELPLEYKRIIFNDILDAVINLTRHKMELQNIRLITDFQTGIVMLKGDTNRLQQALLNLIFNAIEAMPKSGELSITSRLVKKNREIQVEIRDTGYGISEQHINQIFDPFFTTKKEGEGTGLGLSIVYGVVKNHGGKVLVKSQENEGTVFILNFPVL